jgi:hypothetical protein
LTGLLMLTWPLAATFAVAAALVASAGLADGPGLTAMLGVRQGHAPRAAYGRVVTMGVSLKVAAFATVAAITPAGIAVFGIRGCLIACAALQLGGAVAGAAIVLAHRPTASDT